MLQTANVPAMREERRSEPRFPVFLAATARNGTAAARVQLRNLSRSGALAEAPRPPAQASRVVLARDGLLVAAEVVWVSGMRFGLAFDQPIRATDLLLQLSQNRLAG
ncbi:MAG TPA: PilZ domain-containing protein [Allosphingosinicella sp.]|jgi:hypothetical protein